MDKQNEKNTAPMKLGLDTMETGKALDVLMEVLPDVAVILNDPEADGIIKQLKGDISDVEAGDAYRILIPLFARKYKPQLLRIVAACQGSTMDEVNKQSLTKTVTSFASSLRMMNSFFVCCLHMVRNM